MNRNFLCIILMLTVAPVIASSTLVVMDPSRWGGSFNPLNILVMALFGLITVPMWLTYLPALIITPILMRVVARTLVFKSIQLRVLVGMAGVVGAILGSLVMTPVVWLSLTDHESRLAMNWALAGASAGAITLPLIVLVYRREARALKPPPLPIQS